eukprot:2084463-Amphidinium_carterae.1
MDSDAPPKAGPNAAATQRSSQGTRSARVTKRWAAPEWVRQLRDTALIELPDLQLNSNEIVSSQVVPATPRMQSQPQEPALANTPSRTRRAALRAHPTHLCHKLTA